MLHCVGHLQSIHTLSGGGGSGSNNPSQASAGTLRIYSCVIPHSETVRL